MSVKVLTIEWALKPANAPIGVTSYEVKQYLPSDEELNNLLTDEQ